MKIMNGLSVRGKLKLSSLVLLIVCLNGLFTSCEKDPTGDLGEQVGVGAYLAEKEITVSNLGGDAKVEFIALGAWTLSCSEDWVQIDDVHKVGNAGDAVAMVLVDANPSDTLMREATLVLSVEGYSDDVSLKLIQEAKDESEKFGNPANIWISDLMRDMYLWNREYAEIESVLNYHEPNPEDFLNSALNKIKGNKDDGSADADGNRFFYTSLNTYVFQSQPRTMVEQRMKANSGEINTKLSPRTDFGFALLYPVPLGDGNYYLLVGGVNPESPATGAGFKRGDYVTRYNGQPINEFSLATAYNTLMGYEQGQELVKLGLGRYVEKGKGVYELEDRGEANINLYQYSFDPMMFKAVMASGTTKVAYMAYSAFDQFSDFQLIETFKNIKAAGVKELILDLRINLGGDVQASTTMASAIAPNSVRGKVYCEMEFNELRKSRGEKGVFYLGENPGIDGLNYPLIKEAMNNTLGLKRVYVITSYLTASASELIINGLRGVGVDVYVVGQKTEGKNVGMEVRMSNDPQFSDYKLDPNVVYEFAPITFRNLNAKGESNFTNGFTPDFEYVDTEDILFDWGTMGDKIDLGIFAIFEHIKTGKWIKPRQSVRSQSPMKGQHILQPIQVKGLTPRGGGSKVYRY